jgi:hypothetical protein
MKNKAMFSHADAGKERNCSLCEKRKATVKMDSTVDNRCAGCAKIEIEAYSTMKATIRRKILERR